MKVGIVGVGNVGSMIAYTLLTGETVSEIVLVDNPVAKAKGHALDLKHGLQFVSYADISYGGLESLIDCDIIILSAGIPRKPGESRLDLSRKNVELFRELVPSISKVNDRAIYIVVSNPLDILTYATIKFSGKDPAKVIGSGNILDSARLRSILGDYYKIDPSNIHAYQLGEHGDSSFTVWSHAFIGCNPLTSMKDYDAREMEKISKKVKDIAAEVISLKGSTNFAIGLGVVKIVKSIVLDKNRVLPVSTLLDDINGAKDVCLSMPTVIGKGGVKKVYEIPFNKKEQKQFQNSYQTISQELEKLGLKK